MISNETKEALKSKYKLHPLIFARSLERAKNDVELFDLLDSFPNKFPVKWCDSNYCWVEIKKNEHT